MVPLKANSPFKQSVYDEKKKMFGQVDIIDVFFKIDTLY